MTQNTKLFSLSSGSINNMLSNKMVHGFTLGHMRNIIGSITFERACNTLDGTVEEKVEAGVEAVMAALDHINTKSPWYYIDPRLVWKLVNDDRGLFLQLYKGPVTRDDMVENIAEWELFINDTTISYQSDTPFDIYG